MEEGTGVILLVLITVSPSVGIPTSMTSMTLYTEKKTWNEARFICEALGGHLLYIKDATKEALVEAYSDVDPVDEALGYFESFHIGLYNIGESNPGVYTWLDCEEKGSWEAWKTQEPRLEADNLCARMSAASSSSKGWSSVDCSDTKMYMCETVGGTCDYELVTDTRGVDSAPYDVGPVSESQCKTICDTAINGGEECWAFTWSSSMCELHFSSNSTFFDDPQNIVSSTDEHLFKKRCTFARVNNASFPLMEMSSWKPYSTCPGSVGTRTGTIYTLYNTNATWADAKMFCEASGQQLLVLDIPQDGLRIQELYGAYSVTFWLGLNGSSMSGFYWTDGTLTTWDDFDIGHPLPGGTETCVADTPDTNTWTTHDCREERPFVCLQNKGYCSYVKVEKTRGLNGDSQGYISRQQCQSDCDQIPDCVGYSYKIFLVLIECRHHISTDPEYLFDPANLETGQSSWSLYRHTCTIGLVFDEPPVLPELEIQGLNVSELSISSSASTQMSTELSPVLGLSSSIQDLSSTQFQSHWGLMSANSVTIVVTSASDYLPNISPSMTEIGYISSFVDHTEISPMMTEVGNTSSYVQHTEISPTITEIQDTSSFVYVTEMSTTEVENLFTSSMEYTPEMSTNGIVSYSSPEMSSSSQLEASAFNTGQTTQVSSELMTSSDHIVVTTVFDVLTTDGLSTAQTSHSIADMSSQEGMTTVMPSGTSVSDTGQSISPSTYETIAISPEPSLILVQPSSSQNSGSSTSVITLSSAAQVSSSTSTVPSHISMTSTSTITTLKSTVLTYCPCRCNVPTSLNETSKLVEAIKEKLILEKTTLTKEIRRRSSAQDGRKSSQNIGYVAITFLSVVFALTFMADVSLLLTHFRMLLGNIYIKR